MATIHWSQRGRRYGQMTTAGGVPGRMVFQPGIGTAAAAAAKTKVRKTVTMDIRRRELFSVRNW